MRERTRKPKCMGRVKELYSYECSELCSFCEICTAMVMSEHRSSVDTDSQEPTLS
jgi:hypothetical protein